MYLPDHELLQVSEAVLQLNVRHKSGNKHTYLVKFDVPDENDLNKQLHDDINILTDLMRLRAHNGKLTINDRDYYAVEVSQLDSPALKVIESESPPCISRPVTLGTFSDAITQHFSDTVSESKLEEEANLSLKEANEHIETEDKVTQNPQPESNKKRNKNR